MRSAYFGPAHGAIDTPVVPREELGTPRQGPILVDEPDTVVVVPPGWSAARDDIGTLVLSHEAAAPSAQPPVRGAVSLV
jgi:N-methylhydantoinase A